MKISHFPAIGIVLLAGASAGFAGGAKTLFPVKVSAELIDQEPYNVNGLVLRGDYRGSGFCAWNQKVFFSAAHMVMDEESAKWGEPPLWNPKSNSLTVNAKKSIQSRGYYRWTNYAELVALDGMTGDAFGRDVILGFAFQKLIKTQPATLNLKGVSDLKKPIRTMITGYPAENNYLGVPIKGYFMHQTGPGVTPYKTYSDRALHATLVTTGGGNSGGPIWTRNPDLGWTAAGVLVGGLPSEATVYAFSSDINTLTRAVTPLIGKNLPESVAVGGASASSRFYVYDRPKTIPDGVPKWTDFPISVSGFELGDTLKSVKLSFKIKTRHQGDLQVLLTAPGGAGRVIHNEEGAGKDDLILVDEDVSESFTDIDPTGKWILRVQDRLKGDIATVQQIQLEIATESGTVTPPP